MEVILLQSIRNLGNLGEIVPVKNGYARNYLFPTGQAISATKANKEAFELEKAQMRENHEKLCNKAKEEILKLRGTECLFITQASDDGRMFGSITKKEIAKKLTSTSGISVKASNIHVDNVIKYTGIHFVYVLMHSGVEPAQIILNVARSENEAQNAMKDYKSNTETKSVIKEEKSGTS